MGKNDPMCEYCGCRDIEIIGRLSDEHYEVVDALGDLRRAIEAGDEREVKRTLNVVENHLFPHNGCEEAGLFVGLCKREYCDYFGPTVDKLKGEHVILREQVHRIRAGEWDTFKEFEFTLRHHIEQEENGLFPGDPGGARRRDLGRDPRADPRVRPCDRTRPRALSSDRTCAPQKRP